MLEASEYKEPVEQWHPHGQDRQPLSRLFARLNAQEAENTGCVPAKAAVSALAEGLFNFLFPINCVQQLSAEIRHGLLRTQLTGIIQTAKTMDFAAAGAIADEFFESLPEIYDMLQADVDACFNFDPAAVSKEEVVTTYPGFFAITVYRLAHALHHQTVPLLPRMLTEYAHSKTGIDIHPAAEIGWSFFIDHGTGIVIGGTAVVGNNVKLYQGVTLGALQVEKALASQKRHPTIEDNVIIYSGASILGGQTVIGHDSIIGGNVFLTESVEPYSIVYHKSQVTVRQKSAGGAISFVI